MFENNIVSLCIVSIVLIYSFMSFNQTLIPLIGSTRHKIICIHREKKVIRIP